MGRGLEIIPRCSTLPNEGLIMSNKEQISFIFALALFVVGPALIVLGLLFQIDFLLISGVSVVGICTLLAFAETLVSDHRSGRGR